MIGAGDANAQNPTPSTQDWLKHQDIIHDLYIKQNRPLKTIRDQLLTQHSFHASVSQYKRKLKEWRYFKNLRASTCEAVVDSLERRGLSATNATTAVDGVTLSPNRLKRALRRHHIPTLRLVKRKLGLEQKTSTPEGISIRRPLINPSVFSNISLPAFSFLEQAQRFFGALQHAAPNTMSHATAIKVPTGVKSASQLQLARTKTMWPVGPGPHEDDPPICTQAGTQSQQPLPTEYNGSSNNHLAVDVLSIFQRTVIRTKRETIAERLLNSFPRQEPDHAGLNLNALILRAGSIDLPTLISYVIYLCANNHLDEVHFQSFMDYLLREGKTDSLKRLIHLETPCTWSFEEEFLLYAARKGRIDLVGLLKCRWTRHNISSQRYKRVLRRMLVEAMRYKHEAFVVAILDETLRSDECQMDDLVSIFDEDLLKRAARCLPAVFPLILDQTPAINKTRCLPYAAAAGCSVEVISSLLIEGAEVNATDANENTALHYSIGRRDFELTKFLLRSGADPKGRGRWSYSRCGYVPPLFLAAEMGNADICELLLQEGADVNSRSLSEIYATNYLSDDECDSWELANAAQMAIYYDQTGVVECLIRHGAIMSGRDGCAPLVFAALFGSHNTVELLIRNGADIHKYSTTGLNVIQNVRPNVGRKPSQNVTALQAACLAGDKHSASLLLEVGARINDPALGHRGGTALQFAALKGWTELVRYLLDHGADVNAPCAQWEGLSALQAAILSKDEELVKILLNCGADVNGNISKRNGRSAIVAAVESGSESIFWRLIEAGADLSPVELEDGSYCCPFLKASETDSEHFVQVLLDLGIDINVCLKSGFSLAEEAIRLAGWGGGAVVSTVLKSSPAVRLSCCEHPKLFLSWWNGIDLGFIQTLVERGWDINIQHEAMCDCPPEDHEHLRPCRYGTFLQKACLNGNLEIVEYLLLAGADPNAPPPRVDDVIGETALQVAVMKENIDLVKLLLRYGADVNALAEVNVNFQLLSATNRTALQTAIEQGSLQIVELLLHHGADVNAPPGDRGHNALQVAIKEGSLQIVELLLHHGADVNAPAGDRGNTALQVAIEEGSLQIVELLLHHGADVNAPAGRWGNTALQVAIKEGSLQIVELLLHYGADVNAAAASVSGVTALQAAAIEGYIRIAQLLLAAGADVGAPEALYNGRTAINGAAERGRLDMVKLLLDNYQLKDGESLSGICEEATEYAMREHRWAVVELLKTYQRLPGSP